MTALGTVVWPPAPIRTDRLVLRESESRDRADTELLASPEVRASVEAIRELVLDDQRLRNDICWSVFAC